MKSMPSMPGRSGRAARTYRQTARAEATAGTRRRIVDACVALLAEHWADEVQLDEVARRSGTTVQTVLRHFGSKDGLFAEGASAIEPEVATRRAEPVPGDVARTLRALLRDYEQAGDFYVRLAQQEERVPALRAVVGAGRRSHRRWLARVFARWLEAAPARERDRLLDRLFVVTDVLVWKVARRDAGMSAAATERLFVDLVQGVLRESPSAATPRGGER